MLSMGAGMEVPSEHLSQLGEGPVAQDAHVVLRELEEGGDGAVIPALEGEEEGLLLAEGARALERLCELRMRALGEQRRLGGVAGVGQQERLQVLVIEPLAAAPRERSEGSQDSDAQETEEVSAQGRFRLEGGGFLEQIENRLLHRVFCLVGREVLACPLVHPPQMRRHAAPELAVACEQFEGGRGHGRTGDSRGARSMLLWLEA